MTGEAPEARRDDGVDDDVDADVPTTYAEAKAKQDEFEQLLRQYDGGFQAASDAQRRGEKPDEDPQGGARM